MAVAAPSMDPIELASFGPVIPVIVIERAEDAVPMARALVEGGVRVLEVTLRTPAALAAIAEATGARFFDAPTAQDLAQIYENLGSRVGFTDEQREVTQLFAAAGLLFVIAGAGLAAHWFNRFP